MLTPRRPNLFLVTMFYLTLWIMLRLLVGNLSEFGLFFAELSERLGVISNTFLQTGVFPVVNLAELLPEFRISAFGLFFFIVPWGFSWVLDLGYLYYARGMVAKSTSSETNAAGKSNDSLGFLTLFEGFNYFVKAIVIRLLMTIMVYGGLFFLFAPGIWARCAFSQANLLLLDNPNRGPIWCLRESNRLMRGHKLEYLSLLLSFLGWYLLTLLPYVFAAARLWYAPYSTVTFVYYYNKLTGQGPAPEAQWQRPGMF